MNACPYTWRVFALGFTAGVWSVVGATALLALHVAVAKKKSAKNPNP